MREKPVFRNVRDAMYWAWYQYHVVESNVPGPTIGRWIKTDKRDREHDAPVRSSNYLILSRWPRGLEAAAEAGNIRRIIDGLPELHRLHLQCLNLLGDDRGKARAGITDKILPMLGTGIHYRRLIDLLVSKAYGRRDISISGLVDRFKNVPARTIAGYYRQVIMFRRSVEQVAEISARDRLTGIVE